MGLFDDYFDPQTFGSDGGGLYSRLLAVARQQGQYQAGAGFDSQRAADGGPAPALAQTSVPLPTPRPAVLDRAPAFSGPQTPDDGPTQNIPIGNDQISQLDAAQFSQATPPGLGDRFSAGLQSWAHTPVGNPIAALASAIAGLTSGQRAVAAGPASSPAPAPDLGDRLSAGLQSWAHTPVGRPAAALANGIAGWSSGQRAEGATVAPSRLEQKVEALKALLGEKDAMLATVDPQGAAPRVAQALMRQAATAKPPAARGLPGRATFPPSNVTAGPTGPRPEAELRRRGLLK